MNVKQLSPPSAAAKKHLEMAESELTADNCLISSEHLWLAARKAAVVALHRRNWPADSDEEIEAAIRLIDVEHGDQMVVLSEFHCAKMFHENATYRFLEKDDIEFFQSVVHDFVDRMLNLDPQSTSEQDADRAATR